MSAAGCAITLDVGLAVGLAVSSAGSGAAWPSPRSTKIPVSNATARIELISHFKNDGIRFTLDTGLVLQCICLPSGEPSIEYLAC